MIPEEQLAPIFRWRPWPPGDPGPEIWAIIKELDARQQREVGAIVLRTQIAMEEARLGGLKQIAEVLGSGGR